MDFKFLDSIILDEEELINIRGGVSDGITCGSNCGMSCGNSCGSNHKHIICIVTYKNIRFKLMEKFLNHIYI